MTGGERSGRSAVAEPFREAGRPVDRLVVPYFDRRVEANPPAGRVEPPDEIDILAVPEDGLEGADLGERGAPYDEGRGRDVADGAEWLHARLVRAEVEQPAV